jgi:hypothetical protein
MRHTMKVQVRHHISGSLLARQVCCQTVTTSRSITRTRARGHRNNLAGPVEEFDTAVSNLFGIEADRHSIRRMPEIPSNLAVMMYVDGNGSQRFPSLECRRPALAFVRVNVDHPAHLPAAVHREPESWLSPVATRPKDFRVNSSN